MPDVVVLAVQVVLVAGLVWGAVLTIFYRADPSPHAKRPQLRVIAGDHKDAGASKAEKPAEEPRIAA